MPIKWGAARVELSDPPDVADLQAEFDQLVALVRVRGRLDDPVIRQRLGRLFARVEVVRYLGNRVRTDEGDASTVAAASTRYRSEYRRQAARLATDIVGLDGLLPDG